jgi:hypothetical protein
MNRSTQDERRVQDVIRSIGVFSPEQPFHGAAAPASMMA